MKIWLHVRSYIQFLALANLCIAVSSTNDSNSAFFSQDQRKSGVVSNSTEQLGETEPFDFENDPVRIFGRYIPDSTLEAGGEVWEAIRLEASACKLRQRVLVTQTVPANAAETLYIIDTAISFEFRGIRPPRTTHPWTWDDLVLVMTGVFECMRNQPVGTHPLVGLASLTPLRNVVDITVARAVSIPLRIEAASGAILEGRRYLRPYPNPLPRSARTEILRASAFFKDEYSRAEELESFGEHQIYTNNEGIRFQLRVKSTRHTGPAPTYGELTDLLDAIAYWMAGLSPMNIKPFSLDVKTTAGEVWATFMLSQQTNIASVYGTAANFTRHQTRNSTERVSFRHPSLDFTDAS